MRTANAPRTVLFCGMMTVKPEVAGYGKNLGFGYPMTPREMGVMTDIPEDYFQEMLDVCSSQNIDWVKVIDSS